MKSIFVNGEPITGNTFIMGEEDITVTAEFVVIETPLDESAQTGDDSRAIGFGVIALIAAGVLLYGARSAID
ncbi:MAG: hypothetical protein GX663_08685 [Clostridiales bacterium]|nr:hypothetical protein [Clostridiales bacterium]